MATDGNDFIVGGEGNDTIEGLGGNDTLLGELGADSLDGGNDADSLLGGQGNDTLLGGQGNDTLVGGAGVDTLEGGDGNDLILEPTYFDVDSLDGGQVFGGLGDDTIQAGRALSGALVVDGGAGTDTLKIVDFEVTLSNLSNIEQIVYEGFSYILLNIGDGVVAAGQTLEISAGDIFNYGAGATINGSAETDGHLDISTLQSGHSNAIADNITGGAQADTIRTYIGNDTIAGGAGNDTIEGGAGLDTAVFSGNYAGYQIDTVAGGLQVTDTDTLDGDDGVDLLQNINVLKFADQSVNVVVPGLYLTGTEDPDSIVGEEGGDTIEGLGGNDTLLGELGADSLDGGNDADSLLGGQGNDTLLGGQGNDTLVGGAGVDTLEGGDGNDLILEPTYFDVDSLDGGQVFGGLGDDTIQAGRALSGALVVDGGAGTDTLKIVDFEVTLSNLSNIEQIVYEGFSYILLNIGDGVVAAGQTLEISAGDIFNYGAGATINGSAETDGHLDISTLQSGHSNAIADNITGGAQADTIRTYIGNDTIAGGAGNDTIEGGAGLDTAVFSGNYAGYQIDTVAGGLQVTDTDTLDGDDGVDLLQNINVLKFADQSVNVVVPGLYLTGTEDPDSIVGEEGGDTIEGLGGNDTLVGELGADSLDGGNDADSLLGGAGSDTLLGGQGNDTLVGGAGVDTLDGGDGNDLILEPTYFDVDSLDGGQVFGGLGDDTIQAGRALSGALVVDGGAGTDTLKIVDFEVTLSNLSNIEQIVYEGFSYILLNIGDGVVAAGQTLEISAGDIFNYGAGATINGSAETDGHLDISTLQSGHSNAIADNITGGAQADTIRTYIGNDTIAGGAGNDTIEGGAGLDTAVFSGNYAGYQIDTVAGGLQVTDTDTLDGDDGVDLLQNINVLKFADQSVNVVVPGLYLTGTDGTDSIEGGEGDDTIDGGLSGDTMSGAEGNDVYYVDNLGDLVSEVGGQGVDRVIAVIDHALTGEVEDLDLAGNADNGTGNALANVIRGNGRANQLDGSSGADTLEGGSGNDIYHVDDINDLVVEINNDPPGALLLPGMDPSVPPGSVLASTLLDGITDTVIAAVNFSIENLDYVEIVTLTGDATQATGNELANILNGNALANALTALGGEDTVNGGEGNDTLYGNLNDDSLAGAAGDDILFGGQHNDTLSGGDNNDYGEGNVGDDSLAGDAGNDTLHGGQGNDRFNGGAGDDSLVGGLGNDTADYSAAAGAITVDLLGGTASGELGSDTLSGMEGVIGGAGGDTLSGGIGNDTLSGGGGNDSVSGGEANDYVYGNLNDDALYGGAGDDSLYGGQHNDVADGGDGADRIEGNLGDDTLLGGLGNDAFVHGGQGNDWVYGNTGDDTLFGGAGNDNVFGGQQNDVLSGGDGEDNAQGNLGDDVMTGDAGADTLHGGQGNDTLAGGIGNDSLVGGLGNDLFRYDAVSLNTMDVGANQADIIGATVGDMISMLGLNDELTINGTALSALTADVAVGNVLDATNNIAFTGGVLQIDLDGNDTFNALNDFQVAISGMTAVTYDGDDDVFRLS